MTGDRRFVALVRLAWRQLRRSTIGWAVLVAGSAASAVAGYKAAYPTPAARQGLDVILGANPGFRALYGVGHRLDTPGGFAAWRIGGPLVIFVGVWALLGVSRLLRGEEENGQWEQLLALGATMRTATIASLVAFLAAAIVQWAVLTAAFLATGLASGSSAFLALGIVGGGVVFGAVAAMTSQLTNTRRAAAGVAGMLLGVAFLARVAADAASRTGWLRWLTPLGWVEELHAFAGSRLSPLPFVAAAIVTLMAGAVTLAARRDLGQGLLAPGHRPRSRLRLLHSPEQAAWRAVWVGAVVWATSLAAATLVFGLLSRDVADFYRESPGFTRLAARLGHLEFVKASGFLSLTFGFVAVAIAAYGATQVTAIRDEEATGRLEHVLARPISRPRWLRGRAVAVVAATLLLAAAPALGGWAGAALRGGGVRLSSMLVGGFNCLPLAALFFGVGLLLFGTVPRLAPGLTSGAIAAGFLLQLVGALARAPAWVLDLSPFHHLAAAPAAPVNALAATVMVALAVVFGAAGTRAFARRDLAGP